MTQAELVALITAELQAEMSAPLVTVTNYPIVVDDEHYPVDEWNGGDREPATLRVLFADAWIEPYVTWAGDIAWRATADGRKAGLK